MIDLRSWAKRWNDASLRQIVSLPSHSSRRGMWLAGGIAIGMVAGALGVYAVTQRIRIAHLVRRARISGHEAPRELDGIEEPISVTSHHSNHRRKAVAEVT